MFFHNLNKIFVKQFLKRTDATHYLSWLESLISAESEERNKEKISFYGEEP